jgi:hypothetical protein
MDSTLNMDVSPETVIQKQLDAYNAKDIEAWLNTYAPDAKQYQFPDTLLTSGREQIRARTAPRFLEPDLHAHLIKRSVMGDVVIDHEIVTRNFSQGRGTVEMTCIYQIRNGWIQTASFVIGEPLFASS